jgi:hypothetical protein
VGQCYIVWLSWAFVGCCVLAYSLLGASVASGVDFIEGAALHGASLGGGQLFHDPLWGGLQERPAAGT